MDRLQWPQALLHFQNECQGQRGNREPRALEAEEVYIILEDKFDFIEVGRDSIANPDYVKKQSTTRHLLTI